MRTSLYSLLIVLSCTACQKTTPEQQRSSSNTGRTVPISSDLATFTGSNAWISIPEANLLIQSYLNSLDSVTDTLIRYFLLDAATIRTYLEDSSILQFKLILAHSTNTYTTAPNSYHGLKANSLTGILVGINATGDYTYYDTDLAINRMTPCPHQCPIVGTAANDLLTITP